MFGFFAINKPPGITSRAALDVVAHTCRQHKFGHAGTLDPLATGVLVVGVGPATRLVSHVHKMPKHYRARFLLGFESETEDIDSPLSAIENAAEIHPAQLEAMLPNFLGKIWQRPPKYSALQIRGKRAYRLARAGREFELAPRLIEVKSLQLVSMQGNEFELDVTCGSGTYVRSLGRDIAEALGSGAVMSALTRTAIGYFRLASSLNLGDPAIDLKSSDWRTHLISPVEALRGGLGLPQLTLDAENLVRLFHGKPLEFPSETYSRFARDAHDSPKECLAVDRQGQLQAVLAFHADRQPAISVTVNFSGYWNRLIGGQVSAE